MADEETEMNEKNEEGEKGEDEELSLPMRIGAIVAGLVISVMGYVLFHALMGCSPASVVPAGDDVLGTAQGGTYTNEYFGFSLTLPDGFEFMSEGELARIVDATDSMMGNEAITSALEDGTMVVVAAAESPEGTVVTVGLQGVNSIAAMFNDADAFLDATAKQYEDQVKDIGLSVKSIERATVEAEGGSLPALLINQTYSSYGFDTYSLMTCMQQGDYYAMVCASSLDEDAPQALLQNISFLK